MPPKKKSPKTREEILEQRVKCPSELIKELHDELEAYYKHERNLLHHYKALNELKQNHKFKLNVSVLCF